ncbi:MAG: hypothetical protein A3C85_03795 [Candidatus Doudnabacteria bacterium RIFCSPHIGHO2_02_FULL_48_21]|uniref:O-antigen ligase-related domain-containing protein n=1 Tax=Candidatus Doudnabacteria bacterium RIFCSPLOWO2_02_FULL_48_13 TaxID=1817845 RepID=A0A1F5QBX2_9BACT|nr:MAG: hypothetical protein A3K05_03290 [Candidatus Doudnabacteria bacterium RIFCSPHIGHO2_01_48_18]OGE77160.1 MAG: hypothetical protein A2668_01610 [Candidatus Doudnabacteria bacterium RIFCSPHIGHO2_01_FULL_48_180]OGE91765.1 MAG: hypothetical protein A3F44_00135 [Candidatus Doudnabacteria bacterium RIFCSPHIGHO2_12_FULL_47_25]OGE93578.1 MAG: hypothetical protein A3C85_03795 [Candidatus Doudnabacteria bacterium RIFCSPHIGHO2_02_FULL_48_21]OGE96524.1 MAG: hypothetical protein A3A83_04325 [Candidatu
MSIWKKISLYTIYIGIGAILVSPILVDNRLFFPFITTKVFLFRVVVEIIFLAFLALNIVSEEYRPKWSWPLVLLTAFVAVAAMSSLLGGNFYLSFWGDIERGEGLNLWLHLLAFFVILTSVVRTREAWLKLLDFSLGASLLLGFFGLGQVLKIENLLATSGTRVDATLGNPAFFAAYLLLQIGIAFILFTLRQSKIARGYYIAVILFYTFLIFTTQTRGAVMGLAAGLIVGAMLMAWVNRENVRVRRLSIGLLLAVLLALGSLYASRDTAFVKNSFLQRIANISPNNRTAQTRLVTWSAAWDGWKEKFVLGWGLENFDVVFNKNFPPSIYEDEGSVVWFDRAHNVILDRGVTTGILGLGLFLTFLIYPAYRLLRYFLRDPLSRNISIVGASLTVAYLVQDLFIFEAVVTYMSLFVILAFFTAQYLPQYGFSFALPRKAILAAAILFTLLLGPMIWKLNLEPLRVNAQAVDALRSDPEKEDFYLIVDRFKKVLERKDYGNQEYRIQFIEFVDRMLGNAGQIVERVEPVLEYTDQQGEKQIEENPENAKNLLLVMRHYNFTYAAYEDRKIERLNKALDLYRDLSELSPTRPQIHHEAGYSYLFLYKEYKALQDDDRAEQARQSAEEMFRKAIDLNPKVVESYVNLIMLYFNSGEDSKIEQVIAQMDERQVNFRVTAHLERLSNLARSNERLRWIGYFNEDVVKLNPDNVQAWINLALFYATSGDRAKAIEIAQKIKAFGGQYVEQAEIFIQSVNRGEYEKK